MLFNQLLGFFNLPLLELLLHSLFFLECLMLDSTTFGKPCEEFETLVESLLDLCVQNMNTLKRFVWIPKLILSGLNRLLHNFIEFLLDTGEDSWVLLSQTLKLEWKLVYFLDCWREGVSHLKLFKGFLFVFVNLHIESMHFTLKPRKILRARMFGSFKDVRSVSVWKICRNEVYALSKTHDCTIAWDEIGLFLLVTVVKT